MSKQHVKITSNGLGCDTHIFVDGVEMTQASAMTIEAVAGGPVIVTFTMHVDELDIDGACKVVEVRQ